MLSLLHLWQAAASNCRQRNDAMPATLQRQLQHYTFCARARARVRGPLKAPRWSGAAPHLRARHHEESVGEGGARRAQVVPQQVERQAGPVQAHGAHAVVDGGVVLQRLPLLHLVARQPHLRVGRATREACKPSALAGRKRSTLQCPNSSQAGFK